jgi:hypothetical protein
MMDAKKLPYPFSEIILNDRAHPTRGLKVVPISYAYNVRAWRKGHRRLLFLASAYLKAKN